MPKKKVIVRWTAVYETVIEVPEDATDDDVQGEAADIKIDVPGSEYQQDTFDIERWGNLKE